MALLGEREVTYTGGDGIERTFLVKVYDTREVRVAEHDANAPNGFTAPFDVPGRMIRPPFDAAETANWNAVRVRLGDDFAGALTACSRAAAELYAARKP
jgi:hypothetical protein